jgi:uncharacterized membrane protein HdeD (DUF308 family)
MNIIEFISSLDYTTILLYISIISATLFVVSLLITPFLICKIPYDYFIKEKRRKNPILFFVSNFFGVFFLLIGIVFLFTPGQGILTILIGIILLDFPKKQKFERYFIQKFNLLPALNFVRKKFNKEEIVID